MELEQRAILSDEECKRLESLNLKKETLNELFITLSRNNLSDEQREKMYQRVIQDMEKVKAQMNLWWQAISEKYELVSRDDYQWQVNFSTKEIVIAPIVKTN